MYYFTYYTHQCSRNHTCTEILIHFCLYCGTRPCNLQHIFPNYFLLSMSIYTTFIWPIVVVTITVVILALSICKMRKTSPILYSALATFPWLMNCIYAIIYEKRVQFLTIFSIIQTILHILTFLCRITTSAPTQYCASSIFAPSFSLAILIAIRRWGNPLYEILCLTATTEVLTWITLLFILTLLKTP